MARVVCECGESFAPFMINGEPRKNCPFCKRQLTVGSDGTLLGTKPAPPPAAMKVPDSLPPVQGSSWAAHSVSRSEGEMLAAQVSRPPVGLPTETHVQLSRFVNPAVLEGALRELMAFTQAEMRKQTHPLACPHSLGCVVAECPRAFQCNALPNKSSGARFILGWTLGVGGGMVAFIVLMFAILSIVIDKPPQRKPDYFMMSLLVAGMVLIPAFLAFIVSWLWSRWQQRYVRALAAATQKTGLHFIPLVQIPAPLADAAFPVICPTPPDYGLLGDAPRAVVKLAGSGLVDRQELYLAQFMFHFNPHDHIPMGGAIKVAQTVLKPSTAFNRPETWQMYLLVLFPEPLPRVPDFVLTPNIRGFEKVFIQRQFEHRLVALPDTGKLRSYLLGMAEPSRATMLGNEFLELLSASGGWSIQVVGSRLMVWKGTCHPDVRFLLPQSGERIAEVIQFASEVRRVLARQGLVG